MDAINNLPVTDMLKQLQSYFRETTWQWEFYEWIIPLVKEEEQKSYNNYNELQHFKDSSLWLWCTDKPEAIPEDKKHLFFQLK